MRSSFIIRAFVVSLALLALTTGAAFAKPGHDDGKMTITGPGINGVIEVTDPEMQSGLSPYNFLAELTPYVEAPQFAEGDGYDIVYYFKQSDGTYEAVERMRYVPDANGGQGYVYYSDLKLNTGTWFQLTPEGEARIQSVLNQIGITVAMAVSPVNTSPVESAPTVTAAPRPTSVSGWLVALGVAAVSALALSGVLLQLRARPRPAESSAD
ncbi:MAG: hypothetical protein HW378_3147 [Anaerolineales bacterium]|nr:hypothetical protein [Anaerolineales bacterium]